MNGIRNWRTSPGRSSLAALAIVVTIMAASSLPAQVTSRTDEIGRLILKWHGEGTAAGLNGFHYQNRDGGHSPFDLTLWPQVQAIQPTEEEKAKKTDVGPANQVRPFPLFGNSSMSASADQGGSLPRIYMANPQGFKFLNAQYLGNNLFVYPEHQDYDLGWNGRGGWGDLYPANVPFVVISQGSSFTDQPFLQAIFSTAAAFPPATQQVLIRNRLLVPTLQAIFRQSNRVVKVEEDYFKGIAHPPVFDGTWIDEAKMVHAAHDMLPPLIPPVAILQVESEEGAAPGRDFFEPESVKDEILGTVPGAVARVFRGSGRQRQIVVSAARSADVMRRPLQYRWELLQGDPSRVTIEPIGDGSKAKITIAWHPTVRGATGINSHRVDIGVFVGNGVGWSAPAFVTFAMLPNEARFYDDSGRLVEICYQAGNPDPGLPASRDLRWLTLGRKIGSPDATLGMRWLADALGAGGVNLLRAMADELAPAQDAWRKLTAAGDQPGATAANTALQDRLQQLLTTVPEGGASLETLVQRAVFDLAASPDLFLAHQPLIKDLLRSPVRATAPAAVQGALADLQKLGVLVETSQGPYARAVRGELLGPGGSYQFRQLHLTLLSELLLPEFLERSTAPAFVDRRLSIPKAWRDVYHYDSDGLALGWTRYANGRTYEFDLEGWLLPEGRGGKSVAVKYVRDEKTGTLIFVPQ
jgi:hypothetical protein